MTFPPFPDAVCAMALVTSSLVSRIASSADRASVQDVAHEQARPPYLASGTGEDPPPRPDHCRRAHAARPVPPHTRHSVRARRSNARSPASPTASSERRRPRYFQPRPPQLPHEPSSPGPRKHRHLPARDHVHLVESLVMPCFDAGQETRRVARRISNLTYRHVSSCLVIFRFPLR